MQYLDPLLKGLSNPLGEPVITITQPTFFENSFQSTFLELSNCVKYNLQRILSLLSKHYQWRMFGKIREITAIGPITLGISQNFDPTTCHNPENRPSMETGVE